MRLRIRGFANGTLVFEEMIHSDSVDLAALAESHTRRLLAFANHMIQIEFLDEPNPAERFFRFGTDPDGMVKPIAIQL